MAFRLLTGGVKEAKQVTQGDLEAWRVVAVQVGSAATKARCDGVLEVASQNHGGAPRGGAAGCLGRGWLAAQSRDIGAASSLLRGRRSPAS